MALRLYLDDSVDSRLLRRLLAGATHSVVTPGEVGLLGADDEAHFEYAVGHGLVLVTKNPGDFEALYEVLPSHPGVCFVYRDNDVTRDMTDHDIARAIANLEASGVPIADERHTLNHWRF